MASLSTKLPLCLLAVLFVCCLIPGTSAGTVASPCKSGEVTQMWTLSPGVKPGDSQVTNVKMDAQRGGCWEITGCSSGQGADVGCGYGCKSLPKSCKSKCDCNGAWSFNSNGSITSVMDGHCLQVSGGKGSAVNVAKCTGGANQRFEVVALKGQSAAIQVKQGDLCVAGQPPPPPTPPPPPPCSTFKSEST